MSRDLALRLGIGAVGFLAGVWGLIEFLRLDSEDIRSALIWIVAGVILHDGVLAPVTVVVTVVLLRLTPRPWRARVTGALVVLGTVTISAIPVLGGFGASSLNPTLLNRNYTAGWIVFAAAVVLVTVAAGVLERVRGARRLARSGEPPSNVAEGDAIREPVELREDPSP